MWTCVFTPCLPGVRFQAPKTCETPQLFAALTFCALQRSASRLRVVPLAPSRAVASTAMALLMARSATVAKAALTDAADGSEDEGDSADDSNGRTGADGEEDFDEGDALHDEGDEEDDEDGVSDGAVGARDHQAQSGAFNNLVPGFLTNVSRLAVRRSSRKRNRSARSVLSTCSRQSAPAPVRDLSFVKQLTVFFFPEPS